MKSYIINPDLLPILTETVDGTNIDLPTLTETVRGHLATATTTFPLSDEQCQQLAELLFPHLEATLHDAIGSRSKARWDKSMQQVRAALPDIIRATVQKPR